MVLLAGCETVKSAKKTTRRRKVLQPKRNLHPAETNTTARPTDFKGPPAFKVFIAQSKENQCKEASPQHQVASSESGF